MRHPTVLALAATAAAAVLLASLPMPAGVGVAAAATVAPTGVAAAALPQRLSETGLFVPGTPDALDAGVIAFSPQYPLWSDGAAKRRWLRLPAGTAIDASRVDAWEFPPGTRLWKEFALGARVETRMIERLPDGTWRFATYVWQADGLDALLAPERGATLALASAPGGRYVVPSEGDCRACHDAAAVPVLGFAALQLSSDRDPLAPHAERAAGGPDLRMLATRGVLKNLPSHHLATPPRIAAKSPVERAALGYLHANCGHCHNDPQQSGAGVPVDLLLAQSLERADSADAVRQSVLGTKQARFHRAGTTPMSTAELLLMRMRSRDPRTQMPPLGTTLPDREGLQLVERWIAGEPSPTDTE